MKKAALIPGELVLKCIEDAIPFAWLIKSLDPREKQYLKLRSLYVKCLFHYITLYCCVVLLWIHLDHEPTQSSEKQTRSFHKTDRK